MTKLKQTLTLAFFTYLVPLVARAQDEYGLGDAAGAAGLKKLGITADTLPGKIGAILFVVLSFIGIIFLIIVIYGGFLWMTAGGNTEQVKKAGAYMKNGAVGIVIILLSYAIVLFVFNNILGASTIEGGGV